MFENYNEIRRCLDVWVAEGNENFAIFPYGAVGMQVRHVLKELYNIDAKFILDNKLCKYNKNIKPLSFLSSVKNKKDLVVILATTNKNIYEQLKLSIEKYVEETNIAELNSTIFRGNHTKVGKYSYGSLCDHWLVEEVGSFTSIATDCHVTSNHPTEYISTHPFIYCDKECHDHFLEYDNYNNNSWYFEGVKPKGKTPKFNKIIIGNDVWLGHGVIITNGSHIGNGAIVAAGAVVTKNVPDYAVVAGIPAKVIKYRYKPEEIMALNKIAWWNWSDEKIRHCHDDFYLPIQEFIDKHAVLS